MPVPKSSTVEESSLNDSSSTREFANSLPNPTPYFEAWLKSLKPSAKPRNDLAPISEFRFEGTLRIDCYVAGVVRSQTGTLIAGETAEVYADIYVATAIIDGLLRGDIHATERVELRSNARVSGNIETPALAIQPGAVFEGRSSFGPATKQSSVTDDSDSSRLARIEIAVAG